MVYTNHHRSLLLFRASFCLFWLFIFEEEKRLVYMQQKGMTHDLHHFSSIFAIDIALTVTNCGLTIFWHLLWCVKWEEFRKTRWIKESIWIRSPNNTMKRDGGTYLLSHLFDPPLKNTPGRKVNTPGNTSTSGDQVSSSRSGSITSTQLWESRLSIDETVSEKRKFSSWSCQNNFWMWLYNRSDELLQSLHGIEIHQPKFCSIGTSGP